MEKKMSRLVQNSILAAVFLAIFVLIGFFGNETVINICSRIVVMSLYAVSFNLMFGYTGMTSIGHALYFGFGGYSFMILMTKLNMGIIPAALLSCLIVIPVAWFLGTAALKNSMLTFSFLTMGLCTTVQLVIYKTGSIGGTVGITHYFLPAWLADFRVLYFFILVAVVICIAIIYMICISPFAQMLQGVRENDQRLLFLGVNVNRMRVRAFVLAALFANIAGILYAFRNAGVYTTSLDGTISMQAIMMAIIGGSSSFFGPILGSIIITILQNFLPLKTQYFEFVIGVILILTAYFMRGGIMGREGLINKVFTDIKRKKAEKGAGK